MDLSNLIMLLSTQQAVQVCGYPLSELTVALHYLRLTLACGKTPTTVTWSERVKIRWHVIVTQQSPTAEQSARKLGNLPLQTGKAADISELQTHHCTTPGQWTWFLCTVGVIAANKLPLQELNQFNLIYAPDFRFISIFWFLVPISRRANDRFDPFCGRPCPFSRN